MLPAEESRKKSLEMLELFRHPFNELQKCTCEDCPHNDKCDDAFDPYNTDGDCLAMK